MPSDKLRVVEVTPDLAGRLPCCGIMNTQHEGHRGKTAWLKNQLRKGLRARLLTTEDGHQVGYIEYLPGELAWRGVDAAGYLFIHCIFTFYRKYQHQGNAVRLVQACVKDARAAGMRGVAVVARSGPWLASSELFLGCGFEPVATAPPDYTLLVKKFRKRDPNPVFLPVNQDRLKRYGRGLTIVHARQCPHGVKFAREIGETAKRDFGLEARHVVLRSCRDAQNAPTPYAVFSVILDGTVVADHQISKTRFANIMRRHLRG
jgi:GNAT superfamily N-acetyltransferase